MKRSSQDQASKPIICDISRDLKTERSGYEYHQCHANQIRPKEKYIIIHFTLKPIKKKLGEVKLNLDNMKRKVDEEKQNRIKIVSLLDKRESFTLYKLPCKYLNHLLK